MSSVWHSAEIVFCRLSVEWCCIVLLFLFWWSETTATLVYYLVPGYAPIVVSHTKDWFGHQWETPGRRTLSIGYPCTVLRIYYGSDPLYKISLTKPKINKTPGGSICSTSCIEFY